ncbi:MFS transporter [Micromonospora eburnea]|uniref:Major Facilitator Superfamily protein n=1 Tax=Micromonospora eburnea TaxID=227316 RepID=A0A1C6TYE0_9ACTN|nr:MFS transporter [Micromonospora eburnea]SCL46850.1 Major Facilitator Superfamily protein [Micromonospora eburnea]
MAPLGALMARTGDEMAGTAVLLFAYGGSSPDDGAAVFGLLAVAAAVGGPLLGVWLDRARSSGPLALSLASFTVGLAAVGVALHQGHEGLAMVVAVLAGLFGPAVAGGWSASLTDPDAARAQRLAVFDASSYSLAGLVSPALAGAAYAIVGSNAPLVLTLLLLGAGTVCAPFARVLRHENSDEDARQSHPLADLRRGIAAITHQPRLRAATVSSCVAFFGFGLFAVLVPAIGQEQFGSPAAGSILLVVLAVAALASNALLDRRGALHRPGRVLTWATVLVGLGIAIAAAGHPVTTILAAVVIGAGDGPQLAGLIQIRHQEASAHLRTQIFTTGASLKITASGIGALAAASLMHAGLAVALLTAAAAHLVAAYVASKAGDHSGEPVHL